MVLLLLLLPLVVGNTLGTYPEEPALASDDSGWSEVAVLLGRLPLLAVPAAASLLLLAFELTLDDEAAELFLLLMIIEEIGFFLFCCDQHKHIHTQGSRTESNYLMMVTVVLVAMGTSVGETLGVDLLVHVNIAIVS